MNYRLPSSLLICSLIVVAGGFISSSKARAEAPRPESATTLPQDAAQENPAVPDISGAWQMSWTTRRGNQRQATLQIKQTGSQLNGEFDDAHGPTSLTGSLRGNQITLNLRMRKRKATFTGTVDGSKMGGATDQGVSWTATRQ